MRSDVIQIIKDEHVAIAAVLYSLRYLVRRMRDHGKPADYGLLRAIFDYIVSYPDRWHRPKENDYLFPAIRARSCEADRLIAELEREHEEIHPRMEELRRLLAAFARDSTAGPAFFEAAEQYIESEWAHIRKEEDVLMPTAERVLTAKDWGQIGAAFRANDDPLFGIKSKEDAERLYQKILSLAPAPIGYAEPG